MEGIIKAVCTSSAKGTAKVSVGQAVCVEDWGLEGDAHAGKWHRQVSLLSYEKIEEFKALGVSVKDGDFGENMVVSGVDFARLPVETRFQIGNVELELTQIGKECHHGCAIRELAGDCVMPREGIFVKILKGGKIKTGDSIQVTELP